MSASIDELVAAFQEGGVTLVCRPSVEAVGHNGVIRLTVDVDPADQEWGHDARVFALYEALRRVADLATMRALCSRYGIDPADITRQLNKEDR